ncbi:MAG: SBBP repeat-containing protein [Myxococcales bacterium]|nr:MAG: SBBP repeat-containing protein [Myxococcales bacterium]
MCQAATCFDGTINQDETDTDCGGSVCGACGDGFGCTLSSDCNSGVCTGNICQAATCSDNIQNQDESDIDCGGSSCGRCVNGDSCSIDLDCISLNCDTGTCAPHPGFSLTFGTNNDDIGTGIASDNFGNIYVTGSFSGTINLGGSDLIGPGNVDVFVASYDIDGNHRWSAAFGGSSFDEASELDIDANGNIYIVGTFSSSDANFGGSTFSAINKDIFVASYDSSGNHRWSKGINSSGDDEGAGIAVDPSGYVYATGSFQNTIDFGGGSLNATASDVFLVKYSTANGSYIWAADFGSTLTDRGDTVTVASSSDVCIAGDYAGTINFGGSPLSNSGGSDIYIACFNASGTHQWSSGHGGPGDDKAYSIATDGNNRVLLTGEINNNVDFGGGALGFFGGSDVFVASFDATGTHIWSQSFGNSLNDGGYDIAAYPSNDVAIVGYFRNSIDFGGGTLNGVNSNEDYFGALFDSTGGYLYADVNGSTAREYSYAFTLSSDGRGCHIGVFSSPTINFTFGNHTLVGGKDFFIVCK